MPRKDQGWITFQTSEEERQLLEEICESSQRTKTEVLRELLRGLQSSAPTQAEQPKSAKTSPHELPKRSRSKEKTISYPSTPNQTNSLQPPKPLKVSSRNVLEGRVKKIIKGPVSTEVTLEIVHRVELTSTITTTSAKALELAEGKTAYAVIKSSDVVIAME